MAGTKPMMLYNGTSYVRINLSDIAFVEANRMYCCLHMTDGKTIHTLSHPLADMEQLLPADDFMRIHRSYVVNVWHVMKILPGSVVLDCLDKPLPIGMSYRDSLLPHFLIVDKRD